MKEMSIEELKDMLREASYRKGCIGSTTYRLWKVSNIWLVFVRIPAQDHKPECNQDNNKNWNILKSGVMVYTCMYMTNVTSC